MEREIRVLPGKAGLDRFFGPGTDTRDIVAYINELKGDR